MRKEPLTAGQLLLHIAREADLPGDAESDYCAASLETEGFIHCSTLSQVLLPADRLFLGQEGLVLLCIDSRLVPHPIVFEDCYDSGEAYPHIYGPLPWTAVQSIIPFPPGADGRFRLPDELERLR